MIAALYVLSDGPYAGRDDVDLWDKERDARLYQGPHPVVAHPPCERWGRYATGGPNPNVPRKRHGDDDGCFAAALESVTQWGGVLEHPAGSSAWRAFFIASPPIAGGWVRAGLYHPHGWTCRVEQGHYGHRAPKPTWLFAVSADKPRDLIWGPSVTSDAHRAVRRADGKIQSICELLSKRQRTLTPPRSPMC